MSRLRQFLLQTHPELHEALERSWKIAITEWLGTIKPSKSSYNAYPHLHNLENYLEQVLLNSPPKNSCTEKCILSPAELYILLSAIVLHDIGRGTLNPEPHEKQIWKIVTNHYTNLGIPSRELAKSIDRIAEAHGRDPMQTNNDYLPTIIIDPYGEIRQESLSAILRLIDHMDSAYTRVVPEYMVPKDELEIIGQFRNVVLGVKIDHEARMVKTVINDEHFLDLKDLPKPQYLPIAEYNEINVNRFEKLRAKRKKIEIEQPETLLPNRIFETQPELFDEEDWKAASRLTQIESIGQTPGHALLAIIMGDVLINSKELTASHAELSAIGLPLAAWLIDYKEHLYNTWGFETYEPIFSKPFLLRIVEGMWELSTRVFGSDLFTYRDLGATIGESDELKISRAARRIHIITQNAYKIGKSKMSAIWVGENQWKWNVMKPSDSNTNKCIFVPLSFVRQRIEWLGDPCNA